MSRFFPKSEIRFSCLRTYGFCSGCKGYKKAYNLGLTILVFKSLIFTTFTYRMPSQWFRNFSLFILLGWGAVDRLEAQQESGPFSEIPEKFSQRQDSLGFFWQVNQNGALTSGETQYLSSGLKLSVGGEEFTPQSGELLDESATNGVVDLLLLESRAGLKIQRSIWFDTERSGLRLIDRIENTGKQNVTIPVDYKSTFPFAWQNLHGTSGQILSRDPEPTLEAEDLGVLVRFSKADGRHDTLLVASGPGENMKPLLSVSSNSRELGLGYKLTIAPGESSVLIHWILQRNLGEPAGVVEVIKPFFESGRLLDSRLDSGLISSVVNFPASAFPKDGGVPVRLDSLIALNRMLDSKGIHRRAEDFLQVSANNRITAQVNPKAAITVVNEHVGELRFPITRVAAIQGGGAMGNNPVVFLRDGQAFGGNIEGENLTLISEGGKETKIEISELNLLSLKLNSADGSRPAGVNRFVQLRGGSVIGVANGADASLKVATSFGPKKLMFSQIAEWGYLSAEHPEFVVVMKDGSRFSAFFSEPTLTFSQAGERSLSLPASLCERLWDVERTFLSLDNSVDAWVSLEEVPDRVRGETNILLASNGLLSGALSEDLITLVDEGSAIQVPIQDIASIQRDFEAEEDGVFVVKLKSGDEISGQIQQKMLTISASVGECRIPIGSLFSYEAKGGQQ